jgi:hypothetical protein
MAPQERARKPGALAALDIVGEGLAQPDGLAERLARQRAARGEAAAASEHAARPARAGQGGAKDHNAWRRGKALLQVAIPEEIHLELSILAKRRRMTLSHLVKDALNQWLDGHGHKLRLPD